ncbi:suppressor of fused domain protein [Plantactinospora sp. S1510]|uniref:Suppressor of fused domain protein n=1 Tax=Plantactinospora alkalitolerans TaxID=2789879 RepID=A0ABS0GN91_9ACTN|nr:suppressor of fused domain protein [Plantactinospora alkalitolerans]MBF9127561.1 suppressor of fused domain protein [Plantactinospora alkalitolerans]
MNEASGAGLLRHEPRYDGFVAAPGQRQEVAEAIDQHLATHFGPVAFVLHEIASHLVGVHVYVVGPTAERPYQTLVTSGMSDRPMTVPPGHGISPYAELMMCLPADWPLTQAALHDERTGWPVRVLKRVARLPHEYGTWIGEWHSVPNGDPALPYAPGTPFAGVVVTPMLNVRPEARTIDVADGTRIDLLALIPLHPAEVALKVSEGTNALIATLDRGGVSELLDPARPSLV